MPYIDQNIYTQYTKPSGTGGKVVPVDNGFLYIGGFGQDPAAEDSRVAVYFIDEAQNQIEVPQPIRLSDAGVPTYGGSPFHPFVEVSKYSISVRDKNKSELFTNKFIGTTQPVSLLEASCLAFNLPTSEAGNAVKNLVVGMDMDDTYGVVAPDGSLWINNSITGVVEEIPDPFYGILSVSGSSVQLIKKRDENRYWPYYNYLEGDYVIGYDNEEYRCLVNNGPSYGGSVTPTQTATTTWRSTRERGVGQLVIGTSSTALPFYNCLKANGDEVSRSDYADLYEFALTNMADTEGEKEVGQYGPGDGTTTFTLPDLRGIFLRFWSDDSTEYDSGRDFGSLQESSVEYHFHDTDFGGSIGTDAGGQAVASRTGANTTSLTGTTYNPGDETALDDETRPVNAALMPWIRY